MQDVSKSVQGIAVYAEFARANATTQIIITPDGYGPNEKIVRMNIVRRTVTKDNPRKQWRFSMIPDSRSVSGADKSAYAEDRMQYASSLFEQLLAGGWSMVAKPILLETSKDDLEAVRNSKTPTKMIYRINQSRAASGYPTEIVNEDVSTIL
jgi:hypothetical protein